MRVHGASRRYGGHCRGECGAQEDVAGVRNRYLLDICGPHQQAAVIVVELRDHFREVRPASHHGLSNLDWTAELVEEHKSPTLDEGGVSKDFHASIGVLHESDRFELSFQDWRLAMPSRRPVYLVWVASSLSASLVARTFVALPGLVILVLMVMC